MPVRSTASISCRASLVGLLLAGHAAAFAASGADADAQAACPVLEPASSHDQPARWTGGCANGLADGDGALTTAHGTVVLGHFSQGKAVTAQGRAVLQSNGGWWTVTTYREAPGRMFMRSPMPAMPGPSIPDVVAAHALAGTWIRTRQQPGGACEAQDTIADDGRRMQRAGDAWSEDGVTVYGSPHDSRLFRVLTTALARKGSHACLNLDPPGDTRVFVVRFDDDAHTSACLSVDGSTCQETWRRAEPAPAR